MAAGGKYARERSDERQVGVAHRQGQVVVTFRESIQRARSRFQVPFHAVDRQALRFRGSLQAFKRDLGYVDGIHVPTAPGQEERVPASAAGEVDGPGRRAGHLHAAGPVLKQRAWVRARLVGAGEVAGVPLVPVRPTQFDLLPLSQGPTNPCKRMILP